MRKLLGAIAAALLLAGSAYADVIVGAPPGGGGSVSISNSDSTLTLSPNPITGVGTISLNLGSANLWTAQQTDQGLTGTSPGWYAQITGDTVPRVRVGLNASDIGSIAFGSGAGTRDVFIERAGAANARHGASDAAAPVAQTISVQSVVAGTSDTAGALWTFKSSAGTGTGAGGGFEWDVAPASTTGSTQNAYVIGLSLNSGGLTIPRAGTASNSPLLLSGTILTGGTATTNFPAIYVQPAGTAAVTSLSTSGTIFGANAPAAFAGAFLDFHVAGAASVFKVISTGATTISGNFTGGGDIMGGAGGSQLGFTGKGLFTSTGSGVIQQGSADAAVAVAQTFRVQSVIAGTAAANGANWTFIGSLPTGTGTSGDIIFQTGVKTGSGTTQGTATTALTIKGETQNAVFAAQIVAANMTQTSAAQSGTVCWAAAGITYDATLGCLASLPELKNFQGPIQNSLKDFMRIRPMWASWKHETPEWKGGDHEVQPVFNARQVATVDKRLVSYGPDGKLRGVRYAEMTAYLTAVVQQQQRQIANDNERITRLERLVAGRSR